jgi:hypothetical protein
MEALLSGLEAAGRRPARGGVDPAEPATRGEASLFADAGGVACDRVDAGRGAGRRAIERDERTGDGGRVAAPESIQSRRLGAWMSRPDDTLGA